MCIFVGGFMLMVAASRAAGWEWHVSERRRSSRCVPHHPAALPLGRPGHQRLRAHSGRTQIPNGGTVRSVASSILLLTSCPRPVQSSFNVSVCLFIFYFQMHIVNMKAIHPNLTAALDDPTGLVVLGFFIDVSLNNLFYMFKNL